MRTNIVIQTSTTQRPLYGAHPFPASRLCGHKSIFVHGPQGSGKNLRAVALCKHFQLRGVLDEWIPGHAVPQTGYLILTNDDAPIHARRVLHIEQALDMLHRTHVGYPF